jgi:amino acid transporter
LVALGIGQIVGAGIYSVIGEAAGHAGDGLWLSFIIAAIPALLTGLSYAELATTYPRAAAEYLYVKNALVFFSYIGFEDIANLAEEAERPKKHLPRAILISFTLTTVLYVGVGLAVLALSAPEQLGRSSAPLATAVGRGVPALAGVLSAVAVFATANTALILLVATSRMVYGMARSKELPRLLASVLPRRKTPWVAALAMLLVAGVLLPMGRSAR